MKWTRFFVQGIPVAQPRPRARNAGKHARVYNPGSADEWKQCVRVTGALYQPDDPLRGPVSVVIEFVMPRPQRMRRQGSPEHVPHTSKPDLDNMVKAVLDAMTNSGWWCDDSQVCALSAEKRYTSAGESPGASIAVAEHQEENATTA